ncbi:hypothetical protein [Streptomyces candidus]|uniref:Uncharacterized protein n=1 Tax=Streptomyces candidus TaxID=67283 RepID=A0A7X0LQL6_9ACTN|nr:hypothetical protein [Streptomyces candidus]MBB6436574.1 hypothetical protein [Streptomyces candidus]
MDPKEAQGGGAAAGAAAAGSAGAAGTAAYDPAAPAPLGVARGATGHYEVDAALERLADVDHLTADGHVGVYEDVHRGLRETLTALDARPGPPATPAPGASPHDIRS